MDASFMETAKQQQMLSLKDMKAGFNIEELIRKKVVIKPIEPPNNYWNGVKGLHTPMFPFVRHMITLGYVEDGAAGIRYLTGLDEHSKEMLQLKLNNPEEYYRKVFEIRTVVAYLTEYQESRKLDIDDPDFWSKTPLRPGNAAFWSKKVLILEPSGIMLNLINYEDIITYYCIKGNGYDVIAPSVDDIRQGSYFYMDENRRSVEVKAENTHQRNKLLGYLYQLYSNKKMSLLVSLAAIVDVRSAFGINDGEQAYAQLSEWIINGTPRIRKEAVIKTLLSVMDKPANYISVRSFVEKLIMRGRIVFRETENTYFSHDAGLSVGKTADEIVAFMSSETFRKELLRMIETYKNEYNLTPKDFDVYKTQESGLSSDNNDETPAETKSEIRKVPFRSSAQHSKKDKP